MAEPAAKEISCPDVETNQNSVEAKIEPGVQGGAESLSNNNTNAESSAMTSDVEGEESVELSEELMARGSKAAKEGDYAEAAECYSRALEIRVAKYGELAPECVNAYYKYGWALLRKAQEEADPLGAVPKKEGHDKEGSTKSAVSCESSAASISNNNEQSGSSNNQNEAVEGGAEDKGNEEDEEESDAEDVAEDDEDESDLDLAWKMLDVARAIVERHPGDTMEKVDILSALAEVALEREDIETSLSDYLKALSILENLVESDSRHLAELNFRICLCLEIGSKPEQAISYCQKAISVCKSRVQHLKDEVKSLSEIMSTSAPQLDQTVQQSSSTLHVDLVTDKKAEIETLTDLSGELEKKLEDLQQLLSGPASLLSDILAIMKAKATEKDAASTGMSSSRMGTANSSAEFESPTVSTAHTNGASGVTHLGVVGRGVKRVQMNSSIAESGPSKKPSTNGGNAS